MYEKYIMLDIYQFCWCSVDKSGGHRGNLFVLLGQSKHRTRHKAKTKCNSTAVQGLVGIY